jgi:hypothetical protein
MLWPDQRLGRRPSLTRPCARRSRTPRVGTKGCAPLGGSNKRIRKKAAEKDVQLFKLGPRESRKKERPVATFFS